MCYYSVYSWFWLKLYQYNILILDRCPIEMQHLDQYTLGTKNYWISLPLWVLDEKKNHSFIRPRCWILIESHHFRVLYYYMKSKALNSSHLIRLQAISMRFWRLIFICAVVVFVVAMCLCVCIGCWIKITSLGAFVMWYLLSKKMNVY